MATMRRVAMTAVLALACLLCGGAAGAGASALPPIKHVFVVVLENNNFDDTFGQHTNAPYLARTLTAQGELLSQYYGTQHESAGDYLAMISGQTANSHTQSDCQFFTEMLPGVIGPDGQAIGQGCVFPKTVLTIADQLTAKGLTWKGYMEDMGNAVPDEPRTCRHPTINGRDNTQSAREGDQYAARHNPFVYFHSIIDSPICARNDVPLDDLPADLASVATTPNYSLISPNLCNDGHDPDPTTNTEGKTTCVDGQEGQLVAADKWLREWVPKILGSPAFQQDGLLMVVFDEAEASAPDGDSRNVPNAPLGPNSPDPGGRFPGPGGGLAGAVLLSRYVEPGSVNTTPYNHFSQLKSFESLFGLEHLGFAARPEFNAFGDDVYNARPGTAPPPPTVFETATNPRVAIAGVPRRCVRKSFSATVHVRASGLRFAGGYVDGKRRATSRAPRFKVRVAARRLRGGRHRLTVRAVDVAGRRGQRSVSFRRCPVKSAQFTG
jgi:hypothetical protein